MTAMELFLAAKHYWKMCVAIILACTLVAGGLFGVVLRSPFEATATVRTMDPSGTVSATDLTTVVSDYASRADSEIEGAVVSSSVGTGAKAQVVSIVAQAVTADEAIAAANRVAIQAADEAERYFLSLEEKRIEMLSSDNDAAASSDDLLFVPAQTDRSYAFCSFVVTEAGTALRSGLGLAKSIAAGFLVGVCVALCALAIRLMRRTPVVSQSSLGEIGDMPVVCGAVGVALGERLWAILRFGDAGSVSRIALLPVDKTAPEPLFDTLQCAVRDAELPDGAPMVTVCPPWIQNPASASDLHEADAVVVCVKRWEDSLLDVSTTLNELSYMKVPVRIVVLID